MNKIWIVIISLVPSILVAKTMTAESVVFCEDLQPRSANLLFEPTKILKVQRANQSQVFEEGVDFTVDGNRLTLTENSRIPLLQHYRDTRDEKRYRFKFNRSKGFIYSPGGVTKHNDYDVEVTYEYEKGDYADFFEGISRSDSLKVFNKLNAGKPVTVAFFGDSITVGAQASGFHKRLKAAPARDGYPLLVFKDLQKRFPKAEMRYVNPSVGGKTSAWGVAQAAGVAAENPDFLVIAFGMNDSSGRVPSEKYLANTQEIIDIARQANPEVSVLLVAEFSPNPNLPNANYDLRKENCAGLFAMQQKNKNCAVVDVGAVSRAMVERKKFVDMSGNNINHPNDFLHQVYADAILAALLGPER